MMIEATMPLPPSANHLFANKRGGGRTKTAAYTAWREDAGYHVKMAWRNAGKPRLAAQPMRLEIMAGLSGRSRDLSNICKAVEDLLVAELPVPDDRWNDCIVMMRSPHVGDGLVRVRLEPLETG